MERDSRVQNNTSYHVQNRSFLLSYKLSSKVHASSDSPVLKLDSIVLLPFHLDGTILALLDTTTFRFRFDFGCSRAFRGLSTGEGTDGRGGRERSASTRLFIQPSVLLPPLANEALD